MSQNFATDQDHQTKAAAIPVLWSSFRDARGENYYYYWLALQSTLIQKTVQSLLVMGEPGSGAYSPVAKWATGSSDPERLTEICESVLEQRCGLLSILPSCLSEEPADLSSKIFEAFKTEKDDSINNTSYAIAYPVLIDNELYGVVALEVQTRAESDLVSVMEQLQWGISWLELYFRRQTVSADSATLAEMKSTFDLLASVLAEEHFSNACMVFVTELANLMNCDRACLGFMKDKIVKLQSISHSAGFSKNMNLVRLISSAMEEAVLQRSELIYPLAPGAKALVTRDHEELSKQQGGGSILTSPLYGNGKYYGAVTLERPAELPFQEHEVQICRGIFALVAPILESKRLHDRLLILKIRDSLAKQLGRLLGAGYIGRKLIALGLAGAIIFLSLAVGDYRLTANTVLEPSVRRSIVSPYNSYVKESAVRPGDVVKKGAILCSLDSRDLHLERVRLLNQQSQYQRQRQEAIATNDRAKANIIDSQLDQAGAQLNLIQSQLKRTNLVAPFDGIVVSGDLSQRIDGSVEQGEVLFELAPLNSYRLILEVDEYRIAEVRKGQAGTLVLPALTDKNFDFIVEKITPISTQKEGKNFFRVEAKLGRVEDSLRPGMEGICKISIDRRKLISIWTRDLTDWLRLKVWNWWP